MACDSETERALYVLATRSICKDIAKGNGNIPTKVKRVDELIFDKATEILNQRGEWAGCIANYKQAAQTQRDGRAGPTDIISCSRAWTDWCGFGG